MSTDAEDPPTLKRKRALSMLPKDVRDRDYRKRDAQGRKVVLVEVDERRINTLIGGGLLAESLSENRSEIGKAIERMLTNAQPITIAK